MSTDDVLSKIRKLLALAADASAAPGEVEAALGRAAHLQRLHGLTDDTIRAHVSGTTENDVRIDSRAVVDRIVMRTSRLGRWESWTASAVAKAALVGCYFAGPTNARAVHFYGLPADVAVAEALFAFALAAGERSAAEYCRRESLQRRSRDANAYRDGFCGGLHKAAERARAEATADTTTVPVMQPAPAQVAQVAQGGAPTMALALVPSRAVVAATLTAVSTYARANLRLTRGRSFRGSGGGADHYSAGRAAGTATSLSRRAL